MVERQDSGQVGGQAGHFPPDTETGGVIPLTRIHGRIHCSTTPEPGLTGADGVIVRHFLKTLAEVATAIAFRKEQR